jgi:hypothetical protein
LPASAAPLPPLVSHPKTYNIPIVSDEPVTREFLARQQQRMLEEMVSFRDDMQVLTAIVMRTDAAVGHLLSEVRAIHGQHQWLANRVRRLEERVETPEP